MIATGSKGNCSCNIFGRAPLPANPTMSQLLPIDLFRDAMSRVPSAVTVVTAGDRNKIRGITIGSFTSVSLKPMLVSFNVACATRMHEMITTVPRFAVHLLSEEQASLSSRFAEPERTGKEQFADVEYVLDDCGTPVLGGAITVFRCVPHATVPAGDHTLIVARVEAVSVPPIEEKPLIYVNRRYSMLGEDIDVPVYPF